MVKLAFRIICLILLTHCLGIASEPVIPWRTDAELEKFLDTDAGITWSETPLRQGLQHLMQSQKICIFLDRRIDPGQNTGISVQNVSWHEIFRHIALQVGADTCRLDSIVYLGPPTAIQKLPTLAAVKRQQARQLDPSVTRHLFRSTRWQWPERTTPRELLERAAKAANFSVNNLDIMPHDLWPAVELPPTNIVDFLTLVTAGFNLSFEFVAEGNLIHLVPVPAQIYLSETYPAVKNSERQVLRFRQIAPTATFEIHADRIIVVGSWQDHQQIRRLFAGRTKRTATAHLEKRYDLHVEAPGEQLLMTVATQLGLKLELDTLAQERLESRIRIDVTQGTVNQLLDAILSPLNIEFKIVDEILYVEGQ